MPRYHFDIDDGRLPTTDADGVECEDAAAAWRHAARTLPALALDAEAQEDAGRRIMIFARIRRADGAVVARVRLSLDTEWTSER